MCFNRQKKTHRGGGLDGGVMSLKYKGFSGSVEASSEGELLNGQIDLIGDLVLYVGKTYDELESAFRNSVDSYIEFCEKHNKKPAIPEKPKSTERGVIPAGTRIKLYEGRVTLLEDVVVDANQEWINKAIKDQEDYFNGIGRVGNLPTESKKSGGAIGGSKDTKWML